MLRRLAIVCISLTMVSCYMQLETVRSINGSYVLETFSVRGTELDVSSGRQVTLNLNAVDRTDMTGTGPCNEFFAEWSHTAGRLHLTNWQTTDLDCPNEQANELEMALFEALLEALEAKVDLGQSPARLVLSGDGISVIWVERPPPATQPTRPPAQTATTTSIPAGDDPGAIDAFLPVQWLTSNMCSI